MSLLHNFFTVDSLPLPFLCRFEKRGVFHLQTDTKIRLATELIDIEYTIVNVPHSYTLHLRTCTYVYVHVDEQLNM